MSQICSWFRKLFHCGLPVASPVDCVVKSSVCKLPLGFLNGLIPCERRLESEAWSERCLGTFICFLGVTPALTPGTYSACSSGLNATTERNAEKTFLLPTFATAFALVLQCHQLQVFHLQIANVSGSVKTLVSCASPINLTCCFPVTPLWEGTAAQSKWRISLPPLKL